MKITQYDEFHSIVEKKFDSSMNQIPREALRLLTSYLVSISQIFPSDLVGVYVRGSLACGGFDPRASDVDIFVVLEERMDAKRFDNLKAVHEDLREQFTLFGPRLEVAYLSRVELSRFDAAPLIAFTATKETDYGTETDGRISPRCGAYSTDQWADA